MVSQRELVLELRLLIDTAIEGGARGRSALDKLEQICATENVLTKHVLHNIGKRRAHWLVTFVAYLEGVFT